MERDQSILVFYGEETAALEGEAAVSCLVQQNHCCCITEKPQKALLLIAGNIQSEQSVSQLGQHSVAIVWRQKSSCLKGSYHPEPDDGLSWDKLRFGEVDQ